MTVTSNHSPMNPPKLPANNYYITIYKHKNPNPRTRCNIDLQAPQPATTNTTPKLQLTNTTCSLLHTLLQLATAANRSLYQVGSFCQTTKSRYHVRRFNILGPVLANYKHHTKPMLVYCTTATHCTCTSKKTLRDSPSYSAALAKKLLTLMRGHAAFIITVKPKDLPECEQESPIPTCWRKKPNSPTYKLNKLNIQSNLQTKH